MQNDIRVLRELATRYAEIAADPIQEERRDLWRRHNSLQETRIPIFVHTGYWDMWCWQYFNQDKMQCQDQFYRDYERQLRLLLFHSEWGDDLIINRWLTLAARQKRSWSDLWGVEIQHERLEEDGSAWQFSPIIEELSDTSMLSWPEHAIDEEDTARNLQKLGDAIGDIVEINVDRGPLCTGFLGDISTHIAQLRGLEQLMVDMLIEPDELHRLMGWMRDGILANQQAAADAGDISATGGQNQCEPYSSATTDPTPNKLPVDRKDLWAFCAAQEFTGISPAMHDEFLLQYQKPIIEQWGLSAYGCCEDLTNKIDMLRQIKNLRIIAVTPRADVRRCAEQIGTDYVISWRPNPADVISCGFDEDKIRRILREGLEACRGCRVHINLKDVYTVEGDITRFARWIKIAREVADSL